MKRTLLIFFIIATTVTTYAQPRAVGLRVGVNNLEAGYQHTFVNKNQFMEGNLGLDFGYNVNGIPGVKATAIYNFIWARPAWTDRGSWALYAGPGASIGYVNDEVHYTHKDGVNITRFTDNGFMLGICGQVGVEYTFWFPLQLSIDLRPIVGMHVNDGYSYTDPTDPTTTRRYASRVGFYDNGLLGFVPSISVRYRF